MLTCTKSNYEDDIGDCLRSICAEVHSIELGVGRQWLAVCVRCCGSCRATMRFSGRWKLFRDYLHRSYYGKRSMWCLSRMAPWSRKVPCPSQSQFQMEMRQTPQQPPKPGHLSSPGSNSLTSACEKHHPKVLRWQTVQVSSLPSSICLLGVKQCAFVKSLCTRQPLLSSRLTGQHRHVLWVMEGCAAPGIEIGGLLGVSWGCDLSVWACIKGSCKPWMLTCMSGWSMGWSFAAAAGTEYQEFLQAMDVNLYVRVVDGLFFCCRGRYGGKGAGVWGTGCFWKWGGATCRSPERNHRTGWAAAGHPAAHAGAGTGNFCESNMHVGLKANRCHPSRGGGMWTLLLQPCCSWYMAEVWQPRCPWNMKQSWFWANYRYTSWGMCHNQCQPCYSECRSNWQITWALVSCVDGMTCSGSWAARVVRRWSRTKAGRRVNLGCSTGE